VQLSKSKVQVLTFFEPVWHVDEILGEYGLFLTILHPSEFAARK
jgi:hypothetical protein